jgi:hypothetical protein
MGTGQITVDADHEVDTLREAQTATNELGAQRDGAARIDGNLEAPRRTGRQRRRLPLLGPPEITDQTNPQCDDARTRVHQFHGPGVGRAQPYPSRMSIV